MELNTLQQHPAYRFTLGKLLLFSPMNRTDLRNKIRRERLNKIRRDRFKTNTAMAEALSGKAPDDAFSASYLSQLLSGHRGIGDDTADKIEEQLELPQGYLDKPIAAAESTFTPEQALVIETYPTITPDRKTEYLHRIAQDPALYLPLMDAVLTATAASLSAPDPDRDTSDPPPPQSDDSAPAFPVERIVNVHARHKPRLPLPLSADRKKNHGKD